jgi:stearoyl-CoA desaturase (delta-9 desaturase)
MSTITPSAIARPPSRPLEETEPEHPDRVRWWRLVPSALIHLGCIGVLWVGFSWVALVTAAALYVLRMFVITAFYHRYFSHRTFRTSRVMQTAAAAIGTTSAQRGPVWWAAHHRDHHRLSDDETDIHSPRHHGVLWSHIGWFFSDAGVRTRWSVVPDWAKFRELVWIEKWHVLGPVALAALMFGFGATLERLAPSLGTNGWQMLVWGFFISTTALHHATFTINSIAHRWGTRRYETSDDSRNNFLLALLTLGEGWHNNHHFNPGCVRQGFYWWEIDLAYYGLWALSKVGIVWDLNPVPRRVFADQHRATAGGS